MAKLMKTLGAGFTLLEMTFAIGIFSLIMIVVVGVMTSVSRAQVKVKNIQEVEDNLRFGLETMSKELRTGSNFDADDVEAGTTPPAYKRLNFVRQDGVSVTYCFSSNRIVKLESGPKNRCAADGDPVSSNAISVDELWFYVIGQGIGPSDGQPRITIIIRAHTLDAALQTSLHIQSTVTQRLRDA